MSEQKLPAITSVDGITGRERRNVVIISLIFLTEFSAFSAIQNLQTSLNQEDGLGVLSLSCIYALTILSSIVAPSIIKIAGIKLSFIFSWTCHVLYTLSNFYPRFSTLVPASILIGMISGPMWISESVFISTNAFVLATRKGKAINGVLSTLNGIFFTMYGLTQIAGNVISSLVLNQGTYSRNITDNFTAFCGGSEDCPVNNISAIIKPEKHIVYILMSIFLAFNVGGLVLTVLLLPSAAKSHWSKESSNLKSIMSCFTLLTDPTLLLLMPLVSIIALQQAILWTDFTKSFISCPFGVRMVGFVMAANGVSVTISALFTSRIAKYTGRRVLFGAASVMNMAIFITLYHWTPQADDIAYIFIVAISWGVVEGVWQTQASALIAFLFKDKTEPAFANYHCCKATSFTVYFLISDFLCVRTRLLIVMIQLLVAMILYGILEVRLYRKGKQQITIEGTSL